MNLDSALKTIQYLSEETFDTDKGRQFKADIEADRLPDYEIKRIYEDGTLEGDVKINFEYGFGG